MRFIPFGLGKRRGTLFPPGWGRGAKPPALAFSGSCVLLSSSNVASHFHWPFSAYGWTSKQAHSISKIIAVTLVNTAPHYAAGSSMRIISFRLLASVIRAVFCLPGPGAAESGAASLV